MSHRRSDARVTERPKCQPGAGSRDQCGPIRGQCADGLANDGQAGAQERKYECRGRSHIEILLQTGDRICLLFYNVVKLKSKKTYNNIWISQTSHLGFRTSVNRSSSVLRPDPHFELTAKVKLLSCTVAVETDSTAENCDFISTTLQQFAIV